MSHPNLEETAIERIGNRYLLAMLLARRINQLKKGAKPLIKAEKGESFYIIAVKEIAAGKIVPVRGSPAQGSEKTPAKEKPETTCPICSQKKQTEKEVKTKALSQPNITPMGRKETDKLLYEEGRL